MYVKAVYCHPAYSTYYRVHHDKCWTGWSTSWNQDCQEKYQWSQICKWHHPYGRKPRRTKEPLDESEKESEKVGLKLNIQKMKIMSSGPITSWQIEWGNNANSERLYFGGLQNHCRWWLQPWNSMMLAPWKKSYDQPVAAKSLQSCPTLCDPIDGSPPGSSVPGILQARILEWVAISFSSAWKWKVKAKLLSHVWLLSDPMDCSLPGSSVHGIFQARVLEWGAIAFSNVCRSFEVSNLSAKLCGFVQRSVLFSSVRTMTEMSLMYFVAYTIVLF